jgi:heme oxygenase
MSLRELTAEKHHDAERTEFVKELLGGSITEERYATFLFNLHPIYHVLESFAMINGSMDDLHDLCRANSIYEDYLELWKDTKPPELCPTVDRYLKYIKDELLPNPDRLFAHIYVRHMGDLAGGQMIAKRVQDLEQCISLKTVKNLKIRFVAS